MNSLNVIKNPNRTSPVNSVVPFPAGGIHLALLRYVLRALIITLAAVFSLITYADESAPKLSATETSVNLGTLSISEPVIHTFTYRNTGSAPLTLDVIDKSCNCGTESHTQGEIPPGEWGYLTIEYTRKEATPDTHDIKLNVVARTNEPRDINFELRARRSLAVSAIPHKIKLESASATAPAASILVIECLREEGEFVEITKVASNSPFVVVKEKELDPAPDKVRHVFTVHRSEAILGEPIAARIMIDTTSKTIPHLEVSVSADASPSIIAEPRILTINASKNLELLEAEVQLRRGQSSFATLHTVFSDQEQLKTSFRNGHHDGEWILHVQLPAAAVAKKLKATVQLIGPDGQTLGSVPVLVYPPGKS